MSVSLGIHIGHHSSCAVVRDGELVAAVQTERLSRRKHHVIRTLSDELPVAAALDIAGVRLDDVERIVSCFQGACPGGFGLHRPLIEPGFSLFDPWDPRHQVISHHLAHAYATYEASSFDEAAILICDYAGSATFDGADYAMGFGDWYSWLTSLDAPAVPKVECVSLYEAQTPGSYTLLERQFNIAHPGQGSFVYSIAGLYENIARYVIGRDNAHGQLMALAAHGVALEGSEADPGPLVTRVDDETLVFRNDWQHNMVLGPSREQKCCLAWRCQEATELALEALARRCLRLAGSRNLAVAGGVFLNILANTRLAKADFCGGFHVPSAPHDAGVSVGCAFHGARELGVRAQTVVHDRLGRRYDEADRAEALGHRDAFVTTRPVTTDELAEALVEGKLIARYDGRAEFGPRALGGRSLLASPLLAANKDRLNRIKGRQSWRPVAPIVPQTRAQHFLDGPDDSWWMTMSQTIPAEHRYALAALSHPDGSTRAQTLTKAQDPALHELLERFGERSGYPILVNTSFNRAGEPIVETPANALEMFLDKPDIDWLVLDGLLVERRDPLVVLAERELSLAPGVFLTQFYADGRRIATLTNGTDSWPISQEMHDHLISLGERPRPVRVLVDQLAPRPEDVELLAPLILADVLIVANPETQS
ncbi:carbamoyltransferase [Pseudenhygromyxa sp. WMMC2535]|uniref:carbamoyltransferase C-terminal domain-containing protein n=1 Tax=Pseudenhygromyxa sp. WMMC2535 TaxID=2712867 RepID=UPI001552946C|nr:carbamoyltransferase C-terminal domain-containing protein [Pseudenhygromyxa sp. WMMC2535]NVB36540.1 carbamoyltransferase [Pseudenhygromyxa sp. WMMC2535]